MPGNVKKIHAIILLTKLITEDITNFAKNYDEATDKKTFLMSMGEFYKLQMERREVYVAMLDDLDVTDDVINDVELELYNMCKTLQQRSNRDRIVAMREYVLERYLEVIFSWS